MSGAYMAHIPQNIHHDMVVDGYRGKEDAAQRELVDSAFSELIGLIRTSYSPTAMSRSASKLFNCVSEIKQTYSNSSIIGLAQGVRTHQSGVK